MADHMRTELVCDALRMAIHHRRPAPGLILHSDRGSQYTSEVAEAHLAVERFSSVGWPEHGWQCRTAAQRDPGHGPAITTAPMRRFGR